MSHRNTIVTVEALGGLLGPDDVGICGEEGCYQTGIGIVRAHLEEGNEVELRSCPAHLPELASWAVTRATEWLEQD